MEEDNMVMRVGSSLSKRRTDEEGRAVRLRDIRRCQGLAEGWPWQPPNDPLYIYEVISSAPLGHTNP